MKQYTIDVPATSNMQAVSLIVIPTPGESFRAAALREYNAQRANAGKKPLGKMPSGTRYGRRGAA